MDGGGEGGRRYQRVARAIVTKLEMGELPTGGRLPAERDLAQLLGVSRPTIREAMVALELAGLVDIRTGSGIYVRSLADRRAAGERISGVAALADVGAGPIELMEARIMLEPEVAAGAARHAGPADVEVVRASVAAMDRATDVAAHRKADHDFHVAIARAAHNSVLVSMVDGLWQEMFSPIFERIGVITRLIPANLDATLVAHRAMLNAVVAGDADASREAMRTHLAQVLAVLSTNADGAEDAIDAR